MINKFRRILIRMGKILPFAICFLACVNYMESAFSIATNDFLVYDDMIILNTPLSFFIGRYFEYNVQLLVVMSIISIAIETCIYNKLACVYLGVNLAEKSFFNFEMELWMIYVIIIANVIVSCYITCKGVRMLKK